MKTQAIRHKIGLLPLVIHHFSSSAEELQCYNASRLEQHAKFQGELEEQELQSRERLRGEEAEFQLLHERFQGLHEDRGSKTFETSRG